MVEISRRRFLALTSLEFGVAVAAVAALPNIALAQSVPSVLDTALLEPMVVHVRDVATAEIAVLIGTSEFVYRDPELVARLVQTANHAANTEG